MLRLPPENEALAVSSLIGAASKPLEILRAGSFEELPWLVHAFSTRQAGVSTCYGGARCLADPAGHQSQRRT